MAIQHILVEDCSPLIQYAPEGAWQDAPSNDTMAALYSGGSYHLSSSRGATATFKFRGTGFAILGGRRPGYGPFSLSLDGQHLYEGNPVPDPSSSINNTLAVVTDLLYDDHTLVFTNSGGAFVDIDSITFEAEIGPTSGRPTITTIDDTDYRITYLPAGAWNMSTGPELQNGTLHYSRAANASASVKFSGNAVALYGAASPDHADISVAIDGRTVTLPPGSDAGTNAAGTSVLLFFADSLSDGQHTMVVSKRPNSNTTLSIDIDSFVFYSSGAPPSSPDTPTIKLSRTIIIAAATVAGAIAICLLTLCVFLIFRRRHQRRRLNINPSATSPVTPTLPMQYPGLVFPSPAPLATTRRSVLSQNRASRLSIAPSYYDDPQFLEGRESLEGGRTASVASSERSILSASHPAMPRIIQVPVMRTLRPPRPPGSLL